MLIDIFLWILKTFSKQSDYDILPIIFLWILFKEKMGKTNGHLFLKCKYIYIHKVCIFFTFLTYIDQFISCIVVCIYVPVLFNYLMNTIGLKRPDNSCRLRWVHHLVSRCNTYVSVYLKSCVIVITRKSLEDYLLVLVKQPRRGGATRTLSKTGCIY